MGLPWVRLDTTFHHNPKMLYLIEDKKFRAAFVYVAGLAYAGQHGTDGYIPIAALPFLHATKRDATALVDVGLWEVSANGWEINGWSEFQPSNAETQERKKKARENALKRWHG